MSKRSTRPLYAHFVYLMHTEIGRPLNLMNAQQYAWTLAAPVVQHTHLFCCRIRLFAAQMWRLINFHPLEWVLPYIACRTSTCRLNLLHLKKKKEEDEEEDEEKQNAPNQLLF